MELGDLSQEDSIVTPWGVERKLSMKVMSAWLVRKIIQSSVPGLADA